MTGILQPHLTDDWFIKFDLTRQTVIDKECFKLLTDQVTKWKIDLKNNLLEIELEQPKYYYEFFLLLIHELIHGKFDLIFCTHTNQDASFLTIRDAIIKEHSLECSYKQYADGQKITVHILKIELNFEEIRSRTIVAIHDATDQVPVAA